METVLTKDRLRDPAFEKEFMILLYPFVQEAVRNEVNQLGLQDVRATDELNGNGSRKHTEIRAGDAIITISSVDCKNGYPRDAAYRKNFASQMNWFAEFGEYFPDNANIYIIVAHRRRAGMFEPEAIFAGIPNNEGTAWNGEPYSIAPGFAQEIVPTKNLPVIGEEEIKRVARPMKKLS